MDIKNKDDVNIGDTYFGNDNDIHDASGLHKRLSLYKVLKNSYHTKENKLSRWGYNLDKDLSNDNEQVYYNPKEKKLLYSIAGTHNLSDVGTDIYLAGGALKSTNRYKEADETLKKSKAKYNPQQTVVVGHSLGSSIGQGVASKAGKDKFYGLDAGYTFGQKTRDSNGNFHHYRTSGDAVSILGSNAKHVKNLTNSNTRTGIIPYDAYIAHNVSNIKKEKIFI